MPLRCPDCGTANPLDASHCIQCGEALHVACSECGFGNAPAARFCGGCGRSLAGPASRVSEERKQVTILFADVVGSTQLGEGMDPETYRSILQDCFERLGKPVSLYGGTVAHLSGDGLLAIFGAPVTHEDDPERAVRAALAIQAAAAGFSQDLKRARGIGGFQIRVGVSAGAAVVGHMRSGRLAQYTAIGDVANVAHQLQADAPPGGILVGESVYRATLDRLEYRAAPAVRIKGGRRSLTVFQPVGERPEAAEPEPQSWGAPLVGRDAEMRLLREYLQRLARGRGGAVMLSGPVGTGKTRLLEETRAAAGQAVLWVEVRCASYDESEPWRLWRRVLQALPNTEGVAPPQDVRFPGGPAASAGESQEVGLLEFSEKVVRVTRQSARIRPLVLALDDLQWADRSSLRLLGHLLENLTGAPILVLLSARSSSGVSALHLIETAAAGASAAPEGFSGERAPARPPGRRIAGRRAPAQKPPQIRELNLAPLKPRESARLLRYLSPHNLSAPDQRRVLERSEGNPLYLEELTRFLRDAGGVSRLPATLQMLTAAQIDRLTHGAKQVARAAAVLGDRCDRVLVEAVLGRPVAPAEWDELITSGLMVAPGPEVVAFRQPLTREAAYEALLQPDRIRFHRRAAEALDSMPAEAPTSLMVQHLFASEQWVAAAHASLKAADQALAMFAYAEAEGMCRRAVECVDQSGLSGPEATALRREALARRGRVAFVSADYAAAAPIFLELAGGAREDNERSHWWIHAARANASRGRMTEALRQIRNALGFLGPEDACREAIEARTTLSYLLLRCDQLDQAIAEARSAVELCARVEAWDEGAAASITLGLSLFERGDTAAAVEALREGLERGAGRMLLKQRAALLYNLGGIHLQRGEMEEARACLEEAMMIAEQVRRPTTLAFVYIRLAEYHTQRNDWQAARQALRVASRHAQRSGHAEACADLELAAGRLAIAERRPAVAARRLGRARRLAEESGSVDLLMPVLIAQADAFLLGERVTSARKAFDRAASLVTGERRTLLAHLDCTQGSLCLEENQPPAAIAALGRCLERCERAELLPLAARAACELGVALRARDGRAAPSPDAGELPAPPQEAQQMLARAESLFRQMGADEYGSRAAALRGQ